MVNNIIQVLNTLWNSNGFTGFNIVSFINSLFNNYNPSTTAATLSLLPRDVLKSAMRYVSPDVLKKLNLQLKYVFSKIANGGALTEKNLKVFDKYFSILNSDSLKGNIDYKNVFTQWSDYLNQELFKVLSSINAPINSSNIDELTKAWIANFIKELGRELIKDGVQDGWAKAVNPELIGVYGRLELIKIIDSSWLSEILYNSSNNTATFKLKTSAKLYTFYSVPRVALSFVEVNRGQEMWNGFGLKYSINPTHWIRKRTFLYHLKHNERQTFNNWQRPSQFRNTYKRKRKS